ncbi:MAG: hypothetical protein GY884_18195 [Proteobacteria bacterium]|nr:hypothetical protein [Pseudomonadota bacterium]
MNSTAFLAFVLAGCTVVDNRAEYYSGAEPTISGLGGEGSEVGNLGGYEVTIQGSRFGDNVDELVVMFGSTNAEILSVSDSEIVVTSPVGPIEGGAVDIRIATMAGQAVSYAEDGGGYLYDVGDLYDDQVSYVVVNDYWYSCFGGASYYDDLGNVDLGGVVCGDIRYIGQVGIDGDAALYSSVIPRSHSVNVGWWSGADVADEWVVETPAYTPFLTWVDDLRQDLPTPDEKITLHNPLFEGQSWCSDMEALGSWYYGGDATHAPMSLGLEDANVAFEGDCGRSNNVEYDASRMDFCEIEELGGDSNVYEADWPVGRPFFMARGETSEDPSIGPASCFDGENNDKQDDETGQRVADMEDPDCNSCWDDIDNDEDGLIDGSDPDCHPSIVIEGPGSGLNNVALTLPEPVRFEPIQGFSGADGFDVLWPVVGMDTCFDDEADDDQETQLDEVALRLAWRPSGFTPSEAPEIIDVETSVRMSITILTSGWYGGDAQPFRTTIVVPDDNNFDTEVPDRAYLDMPVEILAQLPSHSFPSGGCTYSRGQTGAADYYTCTWEDPTSSNKAIYVLTIDRVTEYRLHSDLDAVGGDVIFAYSTGDLGLGDYSNYQDAPYDCGSCLDEDGDGWVDGSDPDCELGNAEDNSAFGENPCNDGFDNDLDDLIDFEDPDCDDGYGTESNCRDDIDNDGDGWVDRADGECRLEALGGEVYGEFGDDDPSWTCTNGADDDGDGWVDADDPGCFFGDDPEDDGFDADFGCNDGVDNDGHGDIDAEDPTCVLADTAAQADEEPAYASDCEDGEDNDADGFVDALDPDCEYDNHRLEFYAFHEVDDRPLTTTACYDGEDNDGDTLVDALDPGCWNLELGVEPDGFLEDEADDGDCTDEVDNDGDTFIDLDDAGCTVGIGKNEADAD